MSRAAFYYRSVLIALKTGRGSRRARPPARSIKRSLHLTLRGRASPYGIALVYTELREKDHAFEWLERAYTERCAGLFDLNVEPKFDPLRSDPRFADILSRVGFC